MSVSQFLSNFWIGDAVSASGVTAPLASVEVIPAGDGWQVRVTGANGGHDLPTAHATWAGANAVATRIAAKYGICLVLEEMAEYRSLQAGFDAETLEEQLEHQIAVNTAILTQNRRVLA